MKILALQAVLVSCLAAWAVSPLVIRWARRFRAFDVPDARKAHTEPVPRVGGIAVVTGFLAGLGVVAMQRGTLLGTGTVTVYWHVFVATSLGLFVVGLVDDLRGLSYKTKFAFQGLAAFAVWLAGFRIERVSVPFDGGAYDLGLLSLPVTLLWILAACNAMNLLDGLDGLAAGGALIMTSAVAVVAVHMGHLGVTAASLALLGSLAGFLPYNFRPARMFLGDCGSLFLGFVLSVISVRGSQKGATAVAMGLPLLVLGVPLIDTALAVARRSFTAVIRARREGGGLQVVARHLPILFAPDRGHIHHRLVDAGLSHAAAVLVLYAVVAAFALGGVVVTMTKSTIVGLLALVMAFVPAAITAGFLLRRSRTSCTSEGQVAGHRGAAQRIGR